MTNPHPAKPAFPADEPSANGATIVLASASDDACPAAADELFAELDATEELLDEGRGTPRQPLSNQPHQVLDHADVVDDTEMSIEAYMAELMQRCQGYSSTPSSGQSPSPSPSVTRNNVTASAPQNQASGQAGHEPRTVTREREAVPERQVALQDLREVANVNSRKQISACVGQRLIFEMRNRLATSLFAMLIALGAAGFAKSTASPMFPVALLALVVAVVWGLKFIALANPLSQLCADMEQEADSSTDEPVD
jgi:hypothetical protein